MITIRFKSIFFPLSSKFLSSIDSDVVENRASFKPPLSHYKLSLSIGTMASNGATESASKVEADNRKIFVGGIHREATQEELRAVMEQFGAVKDATIKIDPMGMSRGFGFVLFEEEASVDACLAAGDLTLKDKKMEGELVCLLVCLFVCLLVGLSSRTQRQELIC